MEEKSILDDYNKGFLRVGDFTYFYDDNYNAIIIKYVSTKPTLFISCEKLERIKLPDGVEEIGERAFGLCKRLIDIPLPPSLKKIGKEAFAYCIKLKSVFIPPNVEEIAQDAYRGCEMLESVYADKANKKYYGNCRIKGYPYKHIKLNNS